MKKTNLYQSYAKNFKERSWDLHTVSVQTFVETKTMTVTGHH